MIFTPWHTLASKLRCICKVLILLSISIISGPAGAQASPEENVVTRLQQYLQIDTTNPPGNESRAVEFFSGIFAAEGIAYETAESAPGRGNIWARLAGGDQPALILLHHMDVVPADPRYWDVPPFSGAVRDGYIYGRGAQDMKADGILHLETFLALYRAGRPLNRDVLFLATADEEAGGFYGAGWLIEHRPEIFDNAGLLLTEGGVGTLINEQQRFIIEITQKVPMWLRLTATGRPGHGSAPRPESAVTRLLGTLERIRQHEFKARIIPEVDTYFRSIAGQYTGNTRTAYANIAEAVKDAAFMHALQSENPAAWALTRNTCSITRLSGSDKINVIPTEAWAELDCRLLPDQDPQDFLRELQGIVDDDRIVTEVILNFNPAVSSTDTALYNAIVNVMCRHYPDAVITPRVFNAFTDSHFFRNIGIDSYGFIPMLLPAEDSNLLHGNNERVPVDSLQRALPLLQEIIEEVVY